MVPLLVLVCACGVDVSLETDFESFEISEALDGLRDCDQLSETFVSVVRKAAEDVDEVVASTGVELESGELSTRVDTLASGAYFEIAEQLGCDMVQQRLRTLDDLRELAPDGVTGEALIDAVIEDVERR